MLWPAVSSPKRAARSERKPMESPRSLMVSLARPPGRRGLPARARCARRARRSPRSARSLARAPGSTGGACARRPPRARWPGAGGCARASWLASRCLLLGGARCSGGLQAREVLFDHAGDAQRAAGCDGPADVLVEPAVVGVGARLLAEEAAGK